LKLIIDGESALNKTISRFQRLQLTVIVAALIAPLISFTTTPAHAVVATCAEGGVCQVGDTGPGGGIVFYVAPDNGTFTQIGASGSMCTTNCKYLEAARVSIWGDNSSDPLISWTIVGNQTSAVTGADGTAIGSGYQNSVDILNQSGAVVSSSTAATVARAFGGGSKSDWYLPSKDELNQLNLRNTTVGGFVGGAGYWSSSESTASGAWGQSFPEGTQLNFSKSFTQYVRPIRAFAPATQIAITRAAVGTQRGAAFTTQPQITIQYTNNDTVTVSSAVVTATISSGGTLVGTTTATASSGVATFSNLGVDGTVGTTYTISYTALDLPVASATVTLTGTTCDGSTFTCQVGDIGPGGGTIFYVAPTTFTQLSAFGSMCKTWCKYLEAAPSSWFEGGEPSRSWATNVNSNQTTIVPAPGAQQTAIGTGYQNSNAIVAQTGNVYATSAAVVARTYRGNGLTDWYLPSKDELNQMCKWVRGVAWTSDTTVCTGGTLNTGAGAAGFVDNFYWSSSEFSGTLAWDQDFASGVPSNLLKGPITDYLRPIRAFGTAPTSISVYAIGGVTAPVRGATPVSNVTVANGYTGTVTWSGSPTTFASSTVYTATITLTAAAGYTLTGVGANSFTVVGATSVMHSADSGIVTAVFPATAASTPTPNATPSTTPAPPPPSFLKVKTSPTISLTADIYTCTAGTLIFLRHSVTEEPSKLAYQKISLLRDGTEVASSVTLKSLAVFEKISTWTGSTMTCQVYAAQENTVGTFSSLGADKYNELAKSKAAEAKAAEAKYFTDRKAAYDTRRVELSRISNEKAIELKVSKTSAQVKAAADKYRHAMARISQTWKAEIQAAPARRDSSIALARATFIQELAKNGLSIIQP
jgi:hypothetical protein